MCILNMQTFWPGLSCNPALQRRLSFGFSEGVGTPGRINMSRRLSTASDASTGSGLLPRKHDCILGELHSAYEDLCKKVELPVAPCLAAQCCSPCRMLRGARIVLLMSMLGLT